MKPCHLLSLAACFLLSITAVAQKKDLSLLLKNGIVKTNTDLTPARLDSFNTHAIRLHNKTTAVLQFESLPSAAVRKELSANGIELLDYIPQNAYVATITGNVTPGLLQRMNIHALTSLTAKQKMHPALAMAQIPNWAVKAVGTVDVQIVFPRTFSVAEVTAALKEKNMPLLATPFNQYHLLSLRIPTNRLEELAALPFVLYVQPALPKDQPLNYNSRVSSRGYTLNTTVADGGRGLNGEGIVLGIGDNADVQYHVDFSGRLIDRTTSYADYHGTHTHGTAAGAGIINEQYRGYAPKATIVSDDYSNVIANAPVYVQDYGMVVTNNSYGVVAGCSYYGSYDIYSYILDQQAFEMPNLQHVFAAGNSGTDVCSPYPAGFHTVLGSYQSAKNTLSVANADYFGNVSASSSKGPVNDGRIKPEITAMGTSVYSCLPTNAYGYSSGTSMAAPAVTGGLALLYQRYRQLHGNTNPTNGLMKALLCNGATDKGTPGPDYSYGFGFMNLERSVEMLENNQYQIGTIANGEVKTHTITVPPNTAQLKVMLYWNDPAPAYVTSQALVNDLDLSVLNPSSVVTFPKILDATPGNVTNAATEGADHINNIEQVVIDNPAAGTYTINIQGSVAQNPTQEYDVVYDFVPVATQLVFPAAGTVLNPGVPINIAWDAYGNGTNTFNLEYSLDNGTNWNTIATNISATDRTYPWTAPTQTSDQVLVRITQNGTTQTQTSAPFTILGTPTLTLSATQCEGYINIDWSAVAGATDYEVLLLRGSEMLPVGTTTATSYSLNSLSKDSTYWVSVRARFNGKPGWRALALSRQPSTGTCSGSTSDNDLKLNAIVAPLSGRKYTTTELHTAAVQVTIKNLDDVPATGFKVGYQINNGTWVFENVSTTIAAGAVYTHTFSTTEDFSTIGSYKIVAVVKNNATDIATANDTTIRIIKQLDNQPINLATAFLDNMETATVATYTTDTVGVQNLDRYDFKPATYGRLRTFINSGVALSGSRALAIDVDRRLSSTPYPVHYLTGTYNLSAYQVATNDVRLQFNSINGCDPTNTANRVWIRGSDTQPWIVAYIPATQGASASIEVSNLLRAQGQDFSASFQVCWGVPASGQVISQGSSKGFLLDDVQLYEVFNDLQLVQIDTPYVLNCGVSTAVPIGITIRNSSNTVVTNVPVKYQINNGTWVFENVGSVAANTTVTYTFNTKADLSVPGVYTITAEVAYSGDTYSANNQSSITVYNSAVITTFPYLQNFESGSGGWYTDGYNSSWQYGTPAASKINRAASGVKAWKTNLTGNYHDNELSYLYSPCFSIGGMSRPTISFSIALDLEDCGASLCDGAWLEFSVDNKNWYNLADLSNSGTNWYKAPFYVWSVQDYTTWHAATMNLPTGYNSIRFRFALHSDPAVNREGMALDDIHVYDNNKGIYTGATMTAPITQTVTGNGWIDFESNGQLIASVQPNNQDLSATDVQAYINASGERYTNTQYYHDRNITIKPANRSLAAPATVRLYFLDTETNALINASGCSSCSKPTSAYDLGISKYSAADAVYENGTLSDDNNTGTWSFITPANVTKVPFDKGYYAEFQVQDFSEFWLSNGSFNGNTPLPLRLLSFSAKRQNTNVLLQWTAADEQQVDRYEIERANGSATANQQTFKQIGEVASEGDTTGQRTYTFLDAAPNKTGTQYYRIKMIDKDGAFRYSEVRAVNFSSVVTWQVYPNPSHGVFHFVYQAETGDKLNLHIQDVTGRTVQESVVDGIGVLKKIAIDLTAQPAGVYILQVRHNGQLQSFKLYKQ